MAGAPHVAVVALGDPASPQTWSGTTAGVLLALRELDVQAHAVDLTLPVPIEQALLVAAGARSRNRYDAHSAALTMRVRARIAKARLAPLHLDGAIQVGTNFSLPPGLPFVTLEDMTLRQALAVHPVFSRMSSGAVQGWERRRARIYDRARMCAVASHWAGDSLVADYGLAPERVAVVGLGANHRIEAHPSERDWRTPRFLFVGIDWERKGGPLLLRAFSLLRETRPDASLDLVGGHPRVDAPGVSAHGPLSRERPRERELIARLFARATCLAMPSQVEPFGIVHIEAAAAGIPSIASSVGGPRDLIGVDGGLVVDPGDEEGLLAALRRLSDPDVAKRMGDAARERARLYTWPKVAQRLLGTLGLPLPDGREPAPLL
jgi:glycosyltransferase involved in cell wall biosynthesis